MTQNIRIGIDVGGTFTHAVAIDAQSLSLIGKAKVLTTHQAKEGVAKGIVESLKMLLTNENIPPSAVRFIAHSTTQATNALLEGDVSPVGILGMGKGPSSWLAKQSTNVGKIELAAGKHLRTWHQFLDTSKQIQRQDIENAIASLLDKGAKAIAISEAFSVDEPQNELYALQIAREMGLNATAGCEVSQLYGLKIRTRTAVINASMLAKMIESANMTEASVRDAGIAAPVMIMRSDGGVMDIDSMRRRPILTILSGPAAGVAAAMMYLHITDGIFLEVGGTSTDISAIRNGKAQVKSAEIGGHKVYLRTLDVRTVGVAGGSMPRMKGQALIDVGPRSAHIAGLGYLSFTDPLKNPQIRLLKPCQGDAHDYIALSDGDAPASVCPTPTDAANLLDLVPEGNCAFGNLESIDSAFTSLARATGKAKAKLALDILNLAAAKCQKVVLSLMKDYKLEADMTYLVGGGGGAAAIVPYLSRVASMKHSLAEHADVISAIGVSLALARETVERQVVNATSDDILRIRQEALAAVEKMGADVSTIEVQVEVDPKTNIVRATACGATSLTGEARPKLAMSEEENRSLAAASMKLDDAQVKLACKTDHFQVFQAQIRAKVLGGIFTSRHQSLRTVDKNGIIRLQTKHGVCQKTTASHAEKCIGDVAEQHSLYGDAGRVIPTIMLLAGPKIIDLSGLLDLNQVIALAQAELETLPQETETIIIAELP